MDDILIYSTNIQLHIKHIHQVLSQLQDARLSIKLSKCAFLMESVEYLGFVVTPNGTTTNPDNVKAVLRYPAPTNVTEVEQFLAMAGVYHRFITKYQLLVKPIRRLKSKSVEFAWTSEQQAAFEHLKEQLNFAYFQRLKRLTSTSNLNSTLTPLQRPV
jgi:hypothetical protein